MKRAWIIRRNEEAVSPVIATILMVAITVVLAAVLYVMVSGLIGGTTTAEPNVQFENADTSGGGLWQIEVAGVSDAEDMSKFKAILIKNGTTVDTLADLGGTSTNGLLTYTDVGGEGRVTSGDIFLATCDSQSSYKLSIIWTDSGNVKGSEDWET